MTPDAARQARRRRSRAARRALRELRPIRKQPDAYRVAAIMGDYLHQRLDLPAREATPAEVANHLSQLGAPVDLIEQAENLFRTCDAARFAPAESLDKGKLSSEAGRLILALEAEPWPSHSA
jgi:hypothetical protein